MAPSFQGQEAPLYVLWDESQLWGLLLLHALRSMRRPVRLVRSTEIAAGLLVAAPPKALLVPGGWAKLKSQSLGQKGREELRSYVACGGRYIGFCGGAGLGLTTEENEGGLALCPWSRKPFTERLPNFSGHIHATIHPHPLHLPVVSQNKITVPVWWPSQFEVKGNAEVSILATYGSPGSDFWVADLDISRLSPNQLHQWENIYGIPLQPDMVAGQPCIIGGTHGKGTYLLSYTHLETPDSPQANALLKTILDSLDGSLPRNTSAIPEWTLNTPKNHWDDPVLKAIWQNLTDMMDLGRNNFLLFWRTPWLIGWRRGIPGSSLNALFAYVHHALSTKPDNQSLDFWQTHRSHIKTLSQEFHDLMVAFLLDERISLSGSPSSPEQSSSPALQRQRQALVGRFPGYGGLFGQMVQVLDELAARLLTVALKSSDDKR